MFYDILNKKIIEILPALKDFKNEFYLAGGTGLALQIGHRDSVDFDFFKKGDINTKELFEKIKKVFNNHKAVLIQEEKNTLSVLIDDIKLSFFGHNYPLIESPVEEENLKVASIKDIGCMKLLAIMGRATNKDYIDLYYILQNIELADLIKNCSEKFHNIDSEPILKSLIYFEDIDSEPINFKNDNYVNFDEIKEFLKDKVKEYYI